MDSKELLKLLEQSKEIVDVSDLSSITSAALENSSELADFSELSPERAVSLKRLKNEEAHKDSILKYLKGTSNFAIFWFIIFSSFQGLVRFLCDPLYTIFDGNGMDILITGVFAQTVGIISIISYHLWKK
jgi:hypothetical protein